MKTKVIQLGETVELNFSYKVDEEVKDLFVKMNKPNWNQTVEAFKYLTDVDDKLDLITPGKILFDLCAFEYSDELHENIQLLMSVCSTLATKYTLPINATLADKKKDLNIVEKV